MTEKHVPDDAVGDAYTEGEYTDTEHSRVDDRAEHGHYTDADGDVETSTESGAYTDTEGDEHAESPDGEYTDDDVDGRNA